MSWACSQVEAVREELQWVEVVESCFCVEVVMVVVEEEEVEVMETLDHLEMVEEMMIVTRFLMRQHRVLIAQEEL